MYDGSEPLGIRRFLEKINDVANLGKWSNDEKVTILKLKLAGIAEEFFLSDPTHSHLTEYYDIARILIKRFEKAVPLSTRLQLFSSASISQKTNDWDEQLPHTMLALNSAIHEATYTSPFFLEHGRDIRLSYTYEKNSDTPQNKYKYVEKLLPSLEQIFNKVLNNLKDQEASHVDLSTRATKQHHYDYKIGSLCFIKTPNIKSNLSPKLRPKFEGPYRVIERFSNVNYRVQHVEQLRKRFNTHVKRMIPFIKRFSYLHLNNLDDLQPDETEVKGIVPSPRYNLRARAGNSAH
ncbi:integrase catalytic domain-containing protein [Trichonephila clavipes]|nr:integrase catalytic domain-containing protein [Trichonephila clavipes]